MGYLVRCQDIKKGKRYTYTGEDTDIECPYAFHTDEEMTEAWFEGEGILFDTKSEAIFLMNEARRCDTDADKYEYYIEETT